jgi:hypothetical protein
LRAGFWKNDRATHVPKEKRNTIYSSLAYLENTMKTASSVSGNILS